MWQKQPYRKAPSFQGIDISGINKLDELGYSNTCLYSFNLHFQIHITDEIGMGIFSSYKIIHTYNLVITNLPHQNHLDKLTFAGSSNAHT